MKYPPPGRMVDIGGRRLHLQASGRESGPVVVLEAGLAATSLSWATVQPLIAEFAHVASYDRAGLGWSDDRVASATALNAAGDLRLLLDAAGLPGPYIPGGTFAGRFDRANLSAIATRAGRGYGACRPRCARGVAAADGSPQTFAGSRSYARVAGRFWLALAWYASRWEDWLADRNGCLA